MVLDLHDATKIHLLIADEQPLFRAGLRHVLEAESDMVVEYETADGWDALEKAQTLHPHVVVTGMNLARIGGLEIVRAIITSNCGIRVLLLTDWFRAVHNRSGSRRHTYAVLPDAINPSELIHTIRQLVTHDTGSHLNAQRRIRRLPLQNMYTHFQILSMRETQVLDCAANGKSNKEIAFLFHIKEQTVKNHMTSILRKTMLRNRTEAVMYGLQRGWI